MERLCSDLEVGRQPGDDLTVERHVERTVDVHAQFLRPQRAHAETLAAPAQNRDQRAEDEPHRRALLDGDDHEAAVIEPRTRYAQVERTAEDGRVDDGQLHQFDLLGLAVVVQFALERLAAPHGARRRRRRR